MKCSICREEIYKVKELCYSEFGSPTHRKCYKKLESLENDKDNNFLRYRILTVTLTPCDKNNVLLKDKAIDIQHMFISDFLLKVYPYGFDGNVTFQIPYLKKTNSAFSFLFDINPVQIKIKYEQLGNLQEDKEISILYTGFVEKSRECGVRKKIINCKNLFAQSNPKGEFLLNENFVIELRLYFTDPCKYFLSLHKGFEIYLNKSYSQIIQETITNLHLSELIKITVDSSFESLSKARDMISLPLASDEWDSASFYDFIMETVKEYCGYFLLTTDGSYKIVDKFQYKTSDKKDIDYRDKLIMRNVSIESLNNYATNVDIYNGAYSNNQGQVTTVPSSNLLTNPLNSISKYFVGTYPSIAEKVIENRKKIFTNLFSRTKSYKMTFTSVPFSISTNIYDPITLKADIYQTIIDDDIDIRVSSYKLKIESLCADYISRIIRGYTSNKKDIDVNLAPFDKNKKTIEKDFYFKCSLSVNFEEKDSSYIYYPKVKKINFPFLVQGKVTVPENVASRFNNKYPYMIYDGFSQKAATSGTEASPSSSYYKISPLPDHYNAYHVTLCGIQKEGKNIELAVPLTPNIGSNQFNSPCFLNEPVWVEIFKEHAKIASDKTIDYADYAVDEKSQINSVSFGPEKQGIIKYTSTDKDNTFLLSKKDTASETTINMSGSNLDISFIPED